MKFFSNKDIKFHKIYDKRQDQPVRHETLLYCAIIFLYSALELTQQIRFILVTKSFSSSTKTSRITFKAVYYVVFNILTFIYFITRKRGQRKANQILETIIVIYLGAGSLYDYTLAIKGVLQATTTAKANQQLVRTFLITSDSLLLFILILTFVRRMYNVIIFIVLDIAGYVALLFADDRKYAACKAIVLTFCLILLLIFIHKKNVKSFFEFWKLKASDTFYKNVLNFLPESIMTFSQEGLVTYNNDYLEKMFACDIKNGLDSFYTNFCPIKLRDCIEDVNFHMPASSIKIPTKPLIENSEETFKTRALNIHTLPDLVNFFKENVHVWRTFHSHVLVFDTKYSHPGTTKTKLSIEIKAFILDGEAEPQLTLIFRDTTDRDTIAALESENQTYKNNVIASFSHELRTPLNSNLGSLEQSMNRPDIPQEVKETLLEPALISAKLLLHLVNDTLDYSQILNKSFQLNLKSLSIAQTVKNCAALFEKRINAKGLDFILDIRAEYEEAALCTDHQRLSQILTNLLSNALKFTFQGKIEIQLFKNIHNDFQVNISDTGIGMDDDVQAKLMKNLEAGRALESKISSNSTGIGIGLTMASTLCQLLSSETNQGLKFSSVKDQGSTFYMTLKEFLSADDDVPNLLVKAKQPKTKENRTSSPLISELSERDDLTEIRSRTMIFKNKLLESKSHQQLILSTSDSSPSVTNPANILIVDDEIFNVMILENYCKAAQLKTERAYNGKEALEKVKETYSKGQRFDMILTDVNMPIMDGYQTAINLKNMVESREIKNDLVIIGVTAYVSKDKIDKCYESGMTEVVNKPLSHADFTLLMKKYKMI